MPWRIFTLVFPFFAKARKSQTHINIYRFNIPYINLVLTEELRLSKCKYVILSNDDQAKAKQCLNPSTDYSTITAPYQN